MEKVSDNEENMSAIFMDFSKVFDTINHGRLLAKQGHMVPQN